MLRTSHLTLFSQLFGKALYQQPLRGSQGLSLLFFQLEKVLLLFSLPLSYELTCCSEGLALFVPTDLSLHVRKSLSSSPFYDFEHLGFLPLGSP